MTPALAPAATPHTTAIDLPYRSPLDWRSLLAYFSARLTPSLETGTPGGGGRYARTVHLLGHAGHIQVGAAPGTDSLTVEISASLLPVSTPLAARLRQAFDLDAEPDAIARHLASSPTLAPLVAARPGLRVPGALDGFELAVRTVLGQQVSVRGASTLAGRLAAALGEMLPEAPVGLTHLPVTADRLAAAEIEEIAAIGLPRARAACLSALAKAVVRGDLPELSQGAEAKDIPDFIRRFTSLPGIGPWTAAYVAMRALRWMDAFPDGDLGLRAAMGGMSADQLRAAAEPWRPWRAYAAQHLWSGQVVV